MARHRTSLLVALIVALILPPAAHAYLDPASGSMMLQAVIGGVAAAAIAVRHYWQRILALFGAGGAEEPESE